MRVRLTTNLTKYNPQLTGGQEGAVNPLETSRLGDRFALVHFDCGAVLDVLWSGLVDLAESDQERAARRVAVADAKQARAREREQTKADALAKDLARAKTLLRKNGFTVLTDEEMRVLAARAC